MRHTRKKTLLRRMLRLFAVLLPLLLVAVAGLSIAGTAADHNTCVRFVKTGAEQMKTGDYPSARDSFVEALRYDDNDAAAHLGLGLTYFHLRDDRSAERELLRAVSIDQRLFPAYQWLGEIYYGRDDPETAVTYWEKAVELEPAESVLRARIQRVKKELRAEKDFNRDVTSHFLVKYEGREKIEAGRVVLRILEDAYSDLGRALSFYPDSELQVILYSNRQFQEVTDAPGWSAGIFDGKIRIPIGGIEKESPGLRRLLVHEYTHAVVRILSPRCPVWLNEGLAQYFEGRDIEPWQREALKKVALAGKLPRLSDLEGSFTGLSGHQAMLAYLFSLSSVRYLIDNFGLYRVKSVLDELGGGSDIRTAIERGISLNYEEFERGWKQSLE